MHTDQLLILHISNQDTSRCDDTAFPNHQISSNDLCSLLLNHAIFLCNSFSTNISESLAMTTSATPSTLVWSSQFSVLPGSETPFLRGDKIILPPSALEQLLSASTVTIPQAVVGQQTSNFDPYNPYTFEAERRARAEAVERQQQLPHPLIFRLVNPENGRIVFAGIREFSAGSDKIGLSPFLRHSLGVDRDSGPEEGNNVNGDSESASTSLNGGMPTITVHVKELPKGTYVRLRPLEAGYDPEDWKSLLEKHLRENFTTLTNGEILSISAGKEEFRFLVDGLKPNGEAVSIVDTDLEVDIEALSEEQARETLKRRLEKSQRALGTAKGSSGGGILELEKDELGQVKRGEYVDYTVEKWARGKGVEFELVSQDGEDFLDLLVTPSGPRQRARPREDEHAFGDFTSRPTKRIKIQSSHADLENSDALWVSVRGYSNSGQDEDGVPQQDGPIHYLLRVTSVARNANLFTNEADTNGAEASSADEDRCKNCRQWVPRRTMMLHENFCYRNNIQCPHCENVFQKKSVEWSNHWHCPLDDAYGNGPSSKQKHNIIFHAPVSCPSCNYHSSNIPNLAQHRTTICPGKLILCTFCHLEVPQQGPDDPDPWEPEVLLSGLTPHELIDGGRTTECHLCTKIVRLRDMPTHLKHHDLERLARPSPHLCRNMNCGRTLDGVRKRGGGGGEIRHHQQQQPTRNELAICDTCFGPLYVSTYDPDGKALRRRVERKYLTQLLTGCGQQWCRNEYCKSGRKNLGLERQGGAPITSKEALSMIKAFLDQLREGASPLHFCVDEASQKRRTLAEMLAAADGGDDVKGKGPERTEGVYALAWCVGALEAESGDLDRGLAWLRDWAPTRAESAR